jgi:hypothetical protein
VWLPNRGLPQHTGRLWDNFNHFWEGNEQRFYADVIVLLLGNIAWLYGFHVGYFNSSAGTRGLIGFSVRASTGFCSLLLAAATGEQSRAEK